MSLYKKKPKVFCIGWHKTGTTTMGEALLILGYNVVGARLDLAKSLLKGDTSKALQFAEEFEAFQDVPWAALYKELDQKFPGSKFIVTTRDSKKWIHSATKHFGSSYVALHEWLYGHGVLTGNEQVYLDRYKNHYEEIDRYFSSRDKDILYVDFDKENPWEEICAFLEVPVPKKVFPHANKGEHTLSLLEKGGRKVKGWIPLTWRRWIMRLFGFPDRRNRFNNYNENQEFISSNKK